ncbi:MAG: orotidine-5'-phosphate decarboxylase [Polyangia bacterium]
MSSIADPSRRLFVALDLATLDEALVLDAMLEAPRVKVGLELFCAAGPRAVAAFVERGREVFLDLKLHDIPETVRRAAAAASQHGASFLTVHASGGRAMLEAAVAGAGRCGVLAVTVLTSLDRVDLQVDGNPLDPIALCVRRAKLAIDAGARGVVCSAREAQQVRAAVGPAALIVTPGVRHAGSAAGDQKRVETPAAALAAGADAVVVGRPIRDAADPRAALQAIMKELH